MLQTVVNGLASACKGCYGLRRFAMEQIGWNLGGGLAVIAVMSWKIASDSIVVNRSIMDLLCLPIHLNS